jgi:hypothetical protein
MKHAWKIYFTLLELGFVAYLGLLLFFSFTVTGPAGLALGSGFLYLIYYAIFLGVNVALYLWGGKVPIVRRILAIVLITAGVLLALYGVFGFYQQKQFEVKYQPLSYDQAAALVEECKVTSVTVASNGWPQLNLSDGSNRVVAGSAYLGELQQLHKKENCPK